jgi:hypothetical protein
MKYTQKEIEELVEFITEDINDCHKLQKKYRESDNRYWYFEGGKRAHTATLAKLGITTVPKLYKFQED